MRIEKLERSKHKQERVLVYLEGGDVLRITEGELLRFSLYVGLDIDDKTVVELQRSGARSETRARAANMVSARPLSRRELVKRLCEKGADGADAEAAADWLEEIGALSDADYAAMLVRHYGGMGYGEAKLRDELYRRGVPRELWEDALSKSPDPREAILRVLAQKTKGRAIDEKERKRLSDMLLRRGFPWSAVRAVLAEFCENAAEPNDFDG